MGLKTEHFRVSDITGINIYESTSNKKPIVLLLHGAGAPKESGVESARLLASFGLFAVVFDAYGYGESPHVGLTLIDPLDIFNIYIKTSGYINQLIDYLGDHPNADTSRVGLIGFSMGAHIIYYYLANELSDAVKVAVPIAGSPRWDNIMRRFIHTFDQFQHLCKEEVVLEYEVRVSAFHPRLDRFSSTD